MRAVEGEEFVLTRLDSMKIKPSSLDQAVLALTPNYGRSRQLGDEMNVLGLRPLLPLHDIELDFLSLLKSFVAFHLDCAVVEEDIRSAFGSDKAIALFAVEPLDRAYWHLLYPSWCA